MIPYNAILMNNEWKASIPPFSLSILLHLSFCMDNLDFYICTVLPDISIVSPGLSCWPVPVQYGDNVPIVCHLSPHTGPHSANAQPPTLDSWHPSTNSDSSISTFSKCKHLLHHTGQACQNLSSSWPLTPSSSSPWSQISLHQCSAKTPTSPPQTPPPYSTPSPSSPPPCSTRPTAVRPLPPFSSTQLNS